MLPEHAGAPLGTAALSCSESMDSSKFSQLTVPGLLLPQTLPTVLTAVNLVLVPALFLLGVADGEAMIGCGYIVSPN